MIKQIKKDKSGACDKYLTDKDRQIMSQKILPSIWYPYELYKHGLTAIFEVFAKKDPEVAREWGRNAAQAAMTTMYSAFITTGDPLSFINNYKSVHGKIYDFGKIEVIEEKPNQVLVKLKELDPECVPIFYIIQGWLERGMELCGAKNAKLDFLTKSWEGKPDTTLRISWAL